MPDEQHPDTSAELAAPTKGIREPLSRRISNAIWTVRRVPVVAYDRLWWLRHASALMDEALAPTTARRFRELVSDMDGPERDVMRGALRQAPPEQRRERLRLAAALMDEDKARGDRPHAMRLGIALRSGAEAVARLDASVERLDAAR